MERPVYGAAERLPHPWFGHIEDRRGRALATLNLAFRKGSAEDEPFVQDVIEISTGNLTDFDRGVLAEWLIQRLEAEGFSFD